jgi:hypothetical protein
MNEFDLSVAQEMIPAKIRRWLYVVISLSGVVLTAILAGFASSTVAVPSWVTISLTVLGVLAGPFGFLAANNVTVPYSLPEYTDPSDTP